MLPRHEISETNCPNEFDRCEIAEVEHAARTESQARCRADTKYVSPSYTRDYPLVAKRGHGAMVEDVDGNVFLDFAAGIAVCATGHCHPEVVAAIQKQAAELIHLSGTDFYYEGMPQLAEKLSSIARRARKRSACISAIPAPKRSKRRSSW